MTNIKPCPFCGLTPNPSPEDEDFDDIPECLICVTCQCFDSGMSDTYVEKPTWNTCPIEDAQTARIVELEAELEKAIAAHDDADPANYMHCACVAPMTARIAELEAQVTALGEIIDGLVSNNDVLKAQLAAVDVSGLPLRSINKRDMAATIMVQSLTIEHLEAQLAAVSPVGDEINLALIDDAEITALKAQLAAMHAADRQRTLLVDALQSELAAVPAWRRIDPNDRTTWPPEHDAWVLNVVRYDDASFHLVATWGRVLNQADLIRFGQQWWLPIRLPWEEADNANQ